MPKRIVFSGEDALKVCRLYTSQRLSVSEIARLMGCSSTPILRLLRNKDVPMRAQGSEHKTTRNQKIMDMRDAGFSDTDIARAFNITRQRVNAIHSRGY